MPEQPSGYSLGCVVEAPGLPDENMPIFVRHEKSKLGFKMVSWGKLSLLLFIIALTPKP